MPTFGPGTFTVGETAAAIDASCLVNNLVIQSTADAGEPSTKLCGTVKPGTRTYSWEMTGNLDIDPEDPDGLFMLSQTAYGTQVPFIFTPNDTEGLTASGVVIIDPLDFGSADGYSSDLTSDFTWAIVDKPTYAPIVPEAGLESVTVTE